MKRALAVIVLLAIASPAFATPSSDRPVQAGTELKAGEEIVTGPGERAQLLFPDGAALALGPRSELALDRLVYDARNETGDLIVSLRRGVLRFTGGETSRTLPSVIATPASTLTVRDGTVIVSVTAAGTTALLVDGREMKVVANGRTEIVSRPGWQSTTLAGNAPSAQVPMPRVTPGAGTAGLEALGQGRGIDQAAASSGRRHSRLGP